MTVLPCNRPPPLPLYRTYPVGWNGANGPMFGDADDYLLPYPVLAGGTWYNVCSGGCGCGSRCEVELPAPVDSITEVTVNGSTVDPIAYEVHDGHLLVRIDGQCWPTCQLYGVEIPGFEVTYPRGTPVPAAVQYATEVLACQFAKHCAGGDCALPQQLRTLTRQGVSLEVEPAPHPLPILNGRIETGIKLVDDIIRADNPFGQSERRQVYSPDVFEPRVRTWIPTS